MRRDLIVPGIIGLLMAAGLYVGASALAVMLPALLQGLAAAVAFVFLLAISLGEIPLMSFGLHRMARSSTPGCMLVATYLIYVVFGAVYASVFVLVTGQVAWGLALAALCIARFASAWWIR